MGPVLVVDDSRVQRRILASLLARMNYDVIQADSADMALEVCKSNDISIIVSDWMMPGTDGLQFCRALRGQNRDNYVYFILLTSKSEKGEIAQGLDAGADDFLTKPVNGDELRARIVAGERILAMQCDLRNALGELREVYEALDQDLIEARKLQQSLIREPEEPITGGSISLFLRSSGRVGGDLVGSYPISPGRIGLYSIDVSGHGVASALLSARLAGYLSATAPDQNIALKRGADGYDGVAPDRAVAMLNDLVLGDIETEHYFTICLAHVDLATGVAEFCQAGHPHPAIQRAGGAVEYVGEGGMPVGLIEGADYSLSTAVLKSGDRLMLYSDGITECANADGDMLEDDGLTGILMGLRGAAGGEVFEGLMVNLKNFAGGSDFADDISAVMLEME